MKNIMFKQGKEGQFAYKGIKDLKTNSLLEFVDPNREVKYMKEFLLRGYNEKTVTYQEILEYIYINTNYIEKQCRSALRELEKEERITVKRREVKSHRGGFKDKYLVTFKLKKSLPKKDLFHFFHQHGSKNKKGMELDRARRIGQKIKAFISPVCEQIQFAGSIRRKNPRVKDIEIVCKIDPLSEGALNRIINDLNQKNIIRILKNGKRYKQFEILDKYQNNLIKADLFIVLPPAQWGVIFLLRTGSAEFSKRFVTEIKPKFKVKNGQLEELRQIKDVMGERDVYIPKKTPTEHLVFETVGWNYIQPEERI